LVWKKLSLAARAAGFGRARNLAAHAEEKFPEEKMKVQRFIRKTSAMTLIELIVVCFVVAILTILVLPMLARSRPRGSHISCYNNLKQTALAYKIWAFDNNDKFPMELSVTNGGTLELMETADAWKTFQVMSNELITPKVIFCWEDSTHSGYATNWTTDLKNKISYFIGRDATDTNYAAILSGDGNFLLNNSAVKPGPFSATTNDSFTWDTTRHVNVVKTSWFTQRKTGTGNLGLADGSVQSTGNSSLKNYLSQTGFATNRFVVP
jgi:competence protein ComGC